MSQVKRSGRSAYLQICLTINLAVNAAVRSLAGTELFLLLCECQFIMEWYSEKIWFSRHSVNKV